MNAADREFVRRRAGDRCEYCGLRQEHSPLARLQVEHVLPKKHGGSDEPDNLALACVDCNLHKGPNLAGLDRATGGITELYNPRRHSWTEHFRWSGALLEGLTPIGRVTVAVLDVNAPERIEHRLEVGEP